MLIEVARAKIVAKVNTLVVQQLLGLLVLLLLVILTPIILLWLVVLWLITLEAKKSVCIDIALNGISGMR